MKDTWTPSEDTLFEDLFANLTKPKEITRPVIILPAPKTIPAPRCPSPCCGKVFQDEQFVVYHGENRTPTCSLGCAVRFVQRCMVRVAGESAHIKVENFGNKK